MTTICLDQIFTSRGLYLYDNQLYSKFTMSTLMLSKELLIGKESKMANLRDANTNDFVQVRV